MKRGEVEAALRRVAPLVPAFEAGAIVDHAMDSAGLQTASPESAAWLSLVAYVRHTFTDYDDLLAQGYDRDSARHFVTDEMNAVLQEWKVGRRLEPED